MPDSLTLISFFVMGLTFFVFAIWFYTEIYPRRNKNGFIMIPASKQLISIEHPDFGVAREIGYTGVDEKGNYELMLKNRNRGVFTSSFNARDYESVFPLIIPELKLRYNPDKIRKDNEEIAKAQLYAWKNLALSQNKDINNAIDKILTHVKQLNKTNKKDEEKKGEKE